MTTKTVKAAKAVEKTAAPKTPKDDGAAPVAVAVSGKRQATTREFELEGVEYTARQPKVAHYQAATKALEGMDFEAGSGKAGLAGADVLMALMRQMVGPDQWAAIAARLEDWEDELDTPHVLRATNDLFDYFTPMLKDQMRAMGLQFPEDVNRAQRRAAAKGK